MFSFADCLNNRKFAVVDNLRLYRFRHKRQLPIREEKKEMKKRLRFNSAIKKRTILKASDYCLDISKLILGGVVLAAVIDMGINEGALFLIGLVIVVSFAAIGFFLYILGNQTKL